MFQILRVKHETHQNTIITDNQCFNVFSETWSNN